MRPLIFLWFRAHLENRWAFGILMREDVFQHLINYNYNWTSDLKNLTARQLELTFTPSQCISLSILEQYIWCLFLNH